MSKEEKEYLEFELKDEKNYAIWELLKGVGLALFAIPGIVYFGIELKGMGLILILLPIGVYLYGMKFIWNWYQSRMRIVFLKKELTSLVPISTKAKEGEQT